MSAPGIWAGVASTVRAGWVRFDAFAGVLAIPVLTLSFWWLVLSVVVWAVLAIITFAGVARSRAAAADAAAAGGEGVGVSVHGRRALPLAFAIAGLAFAVTPVSVLFGGEGKWAYLLGALTFDVMALAMHARLLRLNADVYARLRVAGPEAGVAFALITVGLWSAATAGVWAAYALAALSYRPPA
jgi:predicted NBD/HSP70 family sugar kinase